MLLIIRHIILRPRSSYPGLLHRHGLWIIMKYPNFCLFFIMTIIVSKVMRIVHIKSKKRKKITWTLTIFNCRTQLGKNARCSPFDRKNPTNTNQKLSPFAKWKRNSMKVILMIWALSKQIAIEITTVIIKPVKVQKLVSLNQFAVRN